MLPEDETLKGFQRVLQNYKFPDSDRFDEKFAISRFLKKFEVPDSSRTDDLKAECWSNFISFDSALVFPVLPDGTWYRVRAKLHAIIGSKPNISPTLRFPKGSEFVPTRGANSLQARLEHSRWTCTIEAFDRFAELAYAHKGLKRAVRKRYEDWYAKRKFDINRKCADRFLYDRLNGRGVKVGFAVFKWKLRQIVTIVRGSRFSSVPKNNAKRRPINIEPFGNIIVQAGIGDHIRTLLHKEYGIDLNKLQEEHRYRISSVEQVATIDLQNASDSVQVELCRFLFPKWFFNALMNARSEFVLGPDDNYYLLKKISSMGNGFTFELMTLILTTLCRVLDEGATVYGDDIIIDRSEAVKVISLLQNVGFVVNEDKSFIDGPFRESCGANYHSEYGYIQSFDFEWPTSIGDCIMIFNKVVRLKNVYPAFKPLYQNLYRTLPLVLRGGPDFRFEAMSCLDLINTGFNVDDDRVDFPAFFVTPGGGRCDLKHRSEVDAVLRLYNYEPNDFTVARAYKYKSALRTDTYRHLRATSWAKFEFYLASGRIVDDVLTGEGEWISFTVLNSGYQQFRVKDLKDVYQTLIRDKLTKLIAFLLIVDKGKP